MAICYLGQEELTETNKTTEHIIPNALGGKLKSTDIICHDCNNACGKELDHVLARLGAPFASKLDIKRERGSTPTIIATLDETGAEVLVDPGWNIRKKEPYHEEKGDLLSFSAGTRQRLLQEVERVKKQLLKEGKLLTQATEPQRIIGEGGQKVIFDMSFDKDILMRAASKVIASFYAHRTKDADSLKDIGSFIRNGGDNKFTWMIKLELAKALFKGAPYHIISVAGNATDKILYGYFELLGTFGFITVLNRIYEGPDIKGNHVFDAQASREIESNFDIAISRSELLDFIDEKPNP